MSNSDLTPAQATILLLQTLADAEPCAPTSTGQLVSRSSVPGPGPGRKGPCPTCKGSKRLLGPTDSRHPCHRCQNGEPKPHKCRACHTCHGSGKVDFDSVLGKSLIELRDDSRLSPKERDEKVKEQRASRDRQIVSLERTAAMREGRTVEGDDSPAAAMDIAVAAAGGNVTRSLFEHYDYDPLLRAMDLLHQHDVKLWRRVRARYVPYLERRWNKDAQQWDVVARFGYEQWAGPGRQRRLLEADEGLRFLVARMPDPIRVPARLTAEYGQARRLRVEKLLAEQAPHADFAAIGVVEGLSERRVRLIWKAWSAGQRIAA